MSKWIRWKGFGAFLVICVALALFWILFLDTVVKYTIERIGTDLVGAEVNIDRADVQLSPLGIVLSGLEVTNPAAPEKNIVEFSRIAFSLDSTNLFLRRVIINELALKDARFGAVRKSPGRVLRPPQKKIQAAGKFDFPSLAAPDIKQIIENEQLESVKFIENAQAELRKEDEVWRNRVRELPDKKTIETYRRRIRDIRQTKEPGLSGLTGDLKEARILRRDIDQNLSALKEVRAEYARSAASLRAMVNHAREAPMNDVRRLRDKYSPSLEGLQNLTQTLFGDAVSSRVDFVLMWYERLRPLYDRAMEEKNKVRVVEPLRGKGVDVRFREFRPLPTFLILRSALSADTPAGAVSGEIRNITPDQYLLGSPLSFVFSGVGLAYAERVDVSGVLNHVLPASKEDTLDFMMRGLRIQNLALPGAERFRVSLRDMVLDIDGKGGYTNSLDAVLTGAVKSARIDVDMPEGAGPLAAAIKAGLEKVSQFSLTAGISGVEGSYSMNISSDLDRVLKAATGSVIREQRAGLEKGLRTVLTERTGKQLAEVGEVYDRFNAIGDELELIRSQLREVRDEAIDSGRGTLRLPS